MKQLWYIEFGVDFGDAERGPIMKRCYDLVEADTKDEAIQILLETRLEVEGFSEIRLATESEREEYYCEDRYTMEDLGNMWW